jgi:glycosyltransferase involved in cell wall biosynthesis
VRALWVADEEPNRNRGGGNIRQAYLLEALARSAETHLLIVGPLRDPVLPGLLAGVTEVRPPRQRRPPGATKVRGLSWALFGRQPEDIVVTRPVRRALASPLAALVPNYDVVCMDHLTLAPLIPRRPRQARWVLGLQNLPSVRAAHLAAVTGGRQRWLHNRERRKALTAQRAAADAADTLIAVSSEDAAVLGGAVVVPNGVDAATFTPTPVPANHRMVITGSLGYLPNVDGIAWFCDHVLPLVKAKVTDATLDIVGRDPFDSVVAIGRRPGITLHPDVPDVRPFLDRARVAVVPLRIGSGTRVKALEAMAAGRPVVGTTIGLEGLTVVAGQHAHVADDPATMASRLVEVLTDDGVAAAMAVEARRLVERRFSWAQIGADFVEIVAGRRVTS